jgi:hypothetical protein
MVTIRRRAALSALLLALPLAATACGGSGSTHTTTTTTTTPTTTAVAPAHPRLLGKTAYVREMRLLGKQIGSEFNKIYPIDTGIHGSGAAKQTAQRLQHAHTVFEGVLTTLRTITPPAKVAAAHRQLETGIEGVAGELAQVIKALDAGNFGAATVPSRLSDLSIVDAATSSMEKKGFDVLSNNAGA